MVRRNLRHSVVVRTDPWFSGASYRPFGDGGEIVYSIGFPSSKEVGVDGVKTFFLLLQHTDSIELRLRCKKGIERAFKDKVMSVSEYTNFVDHLLNKEGKPQI